MKKLFLLDGMIELNNIIYILFNLVVDMFKNVLFSDFCYLSLIIEMLKEIFIDGIRFMEIENDCYMLKYKNFFVLIEKMIDNLMFL